MKHPFSKSLLPLLLILSLLLSCLSPILAATGPVTANTGHRHQLCTELSQQALDYYTGQYSYERLSVLPGKASPTDSWAAAQSNQLYTALQSLMTDTHTVSLIYEGYDYGSLGYFWPKTDAVAGSSTYCYFYSDLLRNEISATMNREHIWPKANASYSQLGGGADLHHLRPSISTVNKAKSDYTFGDIADSAYGRTTSLVEGDVVLEILKSHELVEVRDNIKGDVARILLYVYCRWGQPNLYSDVSGSQLPPPDSDDNTNNGVRAIADLETLLRWCEEDPVDQWEMGRNDQAENVQGNRNVFIDYPEFAWLIFGQTPPDTMSTPSGMAANPSFKVQVSVNNSAYGSAELSNGIIIATPNPGYMVGGYQLLNGKATVTRDGNRFLVTPSTSCHIRIIFVVRPMVYVSLSNGLELSGYMDDSVILPEGPTAPEGYTFVGWSPVPVTSTSDSVQYYDAGSNFVLTEDLELYALYTHLVESPVEDGDFVKVTQEPEDWSGEYLLVYEALGYVFNGSITNPNVNTNCRMLVISGSTIPYADGAPFRVTISGEDDIYSIRSASGTYIGNTSGYTGLAYGTADIYTNRISMNNDGTVTICAGSGALFGFLNAQRKFQYFNTTATTRLPIALYVRESTRLIPHYTTELPAGCAHTSPTLVPQIAPTCTKVGCASYYHCTQCGLSFRDKACTQLVDPADLTIPATGHSYDYTDMGSSHLMQCSLCTDCLEADHNYISGQCICGAREILQPTVDSAVTILHSLNLASDISINYVVSVAQLKSYDSFYLSCILPKYENNSLAGSTEIHIQPVVKGSYYYFTLTGLTAVSMADRITATLYMEKNSIPYCSLSDDYSVSDYAYSQLNKDNSTTTLRSLCANLLRYGASAQIYKGYRTDHLADASMTEAHRSYLCDLETVEWGGSNTTLSDLSDPTVTWAGKSLTLGSKVVLRFVIDPGSYNGNPKDLTLHVSYTNYAGVKKDLILTNPTLYSSSLPYYSYDFDGLLAAELRADVSAAVYLGDTQLSQTMVYSAANYGANKTGDLRTLCQALMAYSDAALAQFSG